MANVEKKVIYGVKKVSEDESFWTRIGVGFVNKDGSINLKSDFIPTDPETTIQVRDPKENHDK